MVVCSLRVQSIVVRKAEHQQKFMAVDQEVESDRKWKLKAHFPRGIILPARPSTQKFYNFQKHWHHLRLMKKLSQERWWKSRKKMVSWILG